MKLPRDINGEAFAQHLVRRWDFMIVHQTGSHIVLRTQLPSGLTLSIPAHKPLKTGLFASLLANVATHRNVSRTEILKKL